MFVKGIALTVLVASTPVAVYATQDPGGGVQDPQPAASERKSDARDYRADWQRSQANVKRARAELKAAQRDLQQLRAQLDAALDRLDTTFEPQRDRDCSPSRSRALMSHYQWLRDQGHDGRANGALGKIVDQVGDNAQRLNSVAWDLMTDKQTAGKFDELALAIAKRMEQQRAKLHANHLDTAALAYFLNGEIERAVDLQKQAIAKGGRGDDYRRRLRTYEAAQQTLVKAQRGMALPPATMVAVANEEEEE